MTFPEARGRTIVAERACGRCELCGATSPLTFAHRRSRGQGGLWAPSNGLRLCGSGTTGCHGWTEHEPVLADAGGWRIVGHDTDPALVPVWLNTVNGFGWWLLADEGGYTRAWPEDYGLPEVPVLPPWLRVRP